MVIPPPGVSEPVIKNTFFFPDVDPKRVRELMRLEQTVSALRLNDAIKAGMAETNAELALWRVEQMVAGHNTLADVPADDIDGENVRCFHYFRAVCAMTSATLFERYRGIDATAKATAKRKAPRRLSMSCGGICAGLWRVFRTSRAVLSVKSDESPCDAG